MAEVVLTGTVLAGIAREVAVSTCDADGLLWGRWQRHTVEAALNDYSQPDAGAGAGAGKGGAAHVRARALVQAYTCSGSLCPEVSAGYCTVSSL